MAASCLSFHLIYLLSSCLILGAHGVSIQAYKHSNFTGLLWESNSTLKCNNIPEDKIRQLFSIRTDTCFIAYYHWGCKSPWSEKYLPRDIIVTPDQFGRYDRIRSFHICNKEEGGNQLKVDITTYNDWSSDVSPDVLESYKNVCSCVNVPQYVQNMSKWSIDNHHNAFLAYYEQDCSEKKWDLAFIKAGHDEGSIGMWFHAKTDSVTRKTYKIQSFGPDPNSTYFQISCISFRVITTQTPKPFGSTTESVLGTIAGNSNQAFQFDDLANRLAELQIQFGQLKMNQEKFQNEMLQNFKNFTSKLKRDLNQLLA